MFRPLLLITLAALPAISFAASFDCSKAATAVEKMVCSNDALSHLDEQLSVKYKSALSAAPNQQEFKAQQTSWLKNKRNACTSIVCLQSVYSDRINALASAGGERTITGIVRAASLDSAIEISDDDSIGFLTDSPAGKKIFAACSDGDTCKVTGVVDSADDFPFFKSVSSASQPIRPTKSAAVAQTTDIRAKHAKQIASLGFDKSILSSYLYLHRDLVNPPSKFITFQSFLAALFENPQMSNVTPMETTDGSVGVRWKLQGSPAGGILFQFEDGEAFPTSYIDGNSVAQIETRQDSYVISIVILKMAAAALN